MKGTAIWFVIGLGLIAQMLAGCSSGGDDGPSEFTYRFDQNDEGWVADFADLPVDYDPTIYELDSSWEALPEPLEGHGIYIQGHNRSDDLFMFLKKRVDGFEPNTAYDATFAIEVASTIPEGMMGIGGSPGESVYVKAGATTIEPEVIEGADSWLRMNIDKGQQANGGEDMIVLGNIAYTPTSADDAGEWQIKPLESEDQTFTVTSDGDGAVWFIVGTDSGFEGLTAVYYDTINFDLEKAGN